VTEPRRISGRPTLGILPEAVILPGGERYFLDATLTDTNIRGTDVNQEGQFKGQKPRPPRHLEQAAALQAHAHWRTNRRRPRSPNRRRGRSGFSHSTLAGQTPLRDFAGGHRAHPGTEPPPWAVPLRAAAVGRTFTVTESTESSDIYTPDVYISCPQSENDCGRINIEIPDEIYSDLKKARSAGSPQHQRSNCPIHSLCAGEKPGEAATQDQVSADRIRPTRKSPSR